MFRSRLALFTTVLVAVLGVIALSVSGVWADGRDVTPTKMWNGSVDNPNVRMQTPAFVAHQKAFEILWNAWAIPGPMPAVDFDKEIVLVITGSGSMLKFEAIVLNDNGDLRVSAMESLDMVPGFRYAFATVSREGVLTVNGKHLPRLPMIIVGD